ncbi:phospholipase carboxylesterase [Pyrrhoderma noxium]|uniref:Phospholipase carboxylesterase n=1 Tax=Pyrrhoderma noxium TaxID=2282107 RepID=A0A286U9B3_9AGAM|nr:phospholipase carboxylesterase [Pyrrhoderma noxium]
MEDTHTRELHIKSASGSKPTPRVKTPPAADAIPVPFVYSPSDDGTDENLLILLHGLGDTHVPFGKLGKQLKLPQTATLALRAPQQIPYLYEEAYQWYPSFDDLGEPIVHPNPAPGVTVLTTTISHLTTVCGWPLSSIHLFGFAQGGSLALESALATWKARPRDIIDDLPSSSSSSNGNNDTSSNGSSSMTLGSIITIGGPLLIHHAISSPCPSPTLLIHRSQPSSLNIPSHSRTSLQKLFSNMKEVMLGEGESMPASKEEWEPVMEFWSQRLRRRMPGGADDGLYEVLSGGI